MNLIPYRKADKWGFADPEGKIQVPCVYDYAGRFDSGLAAVEIDKRWGTINEKGQLVAPCRYELPLNFSEGIAAGQLAEEKLELISATGEILSAPVFGYFSGFRDGLAIISYKGGYGIIDRQVQNILDPEFEGLGFFGPRAYRFKRDGHWGLCAPDGEPFIEPQYGSIGELIEDRAVVVKAVNIPMTLNVYDKHGDIDDFETINIDRDRYGVIDGQGRSIIPCDQLHIRDYHDGVTALAEGDEDFQRWYLVDKYGQKITAYDIDHIQDHAGSGSQVYPGITGGILDRHGNWLLQPIYNGIRRGADGGFTAAQFIGEGENADFDYFGPDGTFIVRLEGYELAYPFSGDLARVCRKGLYGYVNREGLEVIPCQYTDACDLCEGLARVKLQQWGVIDQDGRLAIDLKYDVLGPFRDGFAEVRDWSESGYKDYGSFDFHHPGFWDVSEIDPDDTPNSIPWQPLMGYIDRNGREFFSEEFPYTLLT